MVGMGLHERVAIAQYLGLALQDPDCGDAV